MESETITVNVESIRKSAVSFNGNREYKRADLGRAVRRATNEVFGDSVISSGTRNKAVYASAICLLNGNTDIDMVNGLIVDHSLTELTDMYENTLIEAGFVDDDENLAIPGSKTPNEVPRTSIGPVLPVMLGVLSIVYESDIKGHIDA